MAEIGLGMVRNALGAVLFIESANMMMQAFGTHQSSPWTVESFGGDPAKNERCRKYRTHALINAGALAIIAAYAAGSWWPIFGAGGEGLYLWWEYQRALDIAADSGSETWGDPG